MPLIEGLGDEVTIVLGGLLLCVVLALAWLSTHTADIPLLREVGVIVVELSQRRSRTRNQTSSDRSGSEGSAASVEHERTDRETDRTGVNGEGVSVDGRSTDLPNREREGSENDISRSERHLPGSDILGSSSSANVDVPNRETDRSTLLTGSQGLLPELAEALTHEVNQENESGANILSGGSAAEHGLSSKGQGTDANVPKASVIVEENTRFPHSVDHDRPTEDEVRRRRVQYFQMSHVTSSSSAASPSELAAGGESGTATEHNESSSLSDSFTGDSVGAKHIDSDFNTKSTGEARLDTGINSHQTAASASDSGDGESPTEQPANYSAENSNEAPSGSSRIRVKLKYMNETQRLVYASPYDTIGDFRRTHFQPELQDNKWVRFIYNGQDLRDDARTLHACNIGDNCTMHCLITAQTRPDPTREAALEEEDDSIMGAMMYPLFTIILLIVWYFRFMYRQYFSAMSTMCLVGISFLLALSYISSLRTTEHNTQQQQQTGPAEGGGQRSDHPHAE